jgi:hypothetical protein
VKCSRQESFLAYVHDSSSNIEEEKNSHRPKVQDEQYFNIERRIVSLRSKPKSAKGVQTLQFINPTASLSTR